MKLLIITQKLDIDDDNLGFFHAWVEEFAKNIESVSVICLGKGECDLPQNVKIFSLGKEENKFLFRRRQPPVFKKIKYLLRFYKYIWRERKNYDAVFIHMNPEYVVLGGIFWKVLNKKIYLWYTHKQVSFKLKLAEKFADKIFTASKESFRLPSKKVIITGHGIDVAVFTQSQKLIMPRHDKIKKFSVITAGRISEVKNLDILVEACDILKKKVFEFEVKIAGAPILEKDKLYFEKLKKLVKEKKLEDKINFVGKILYKDIASFYQNGNLFINLSSTGSIDKTVLEAMASGLKILTSNDAFQNILPDFCLVNNNAQEIAEKIIYLSARDFNYDLREYVINHHNLRDLIKTIIKLMS